MIIFDYYSIFLYFGSLNLKHLFQFLGDLA
jgi:hypothetical protein